MARQDKSEATTTPNDSQESRGLGLSEPTLLDPHRMNADLRMVNRAVRKRWPIPRSKAKGLVKRLFDITEKTEVGVPTKDGDINYVAGPADEHAIQAARVIVQMMGQNQDDEQYHQDATQRRVTQPPNQVNVNVVNISPDDRRSRLLRIAARLRTGAAATGDES